MQRVIDLELLQLLCCPVDRSPLHEAGPDLLNAINEAIKKKALYTLSGRPVQKQVHGVLVRRDNSVGYLIHDFIPALIGEEGVDLAPFERVSLS
ncbi:MAG: hypothetical protein NTX02_10840 [Planctomycetia bacterium]|nr:hypothetical protein [Planctomycetia bacterium]